MLADYNSKTHRTSYYQATIAYVVHLFYPKWNFIEKIRRLTTGIAEIMFREFSASASTANQEVQQFRRLMTDSESTKVLEQATRSRAENPGGIKPWKVSEHPDWLTRDT